MMSDQRIKIPRATDKALIACFKEIGELTGTPSFNVSLIGFADIGSVNINDDFPEDLNLIIKKNSAIIETISLGITGLPISFHRGGNYQVHDKSAIFDEIVLRQQNNQGTLDSSVTIELVSIINRKLKAFDPKRSVAGATEEQAQYEAIHNSTIERLESLNEDLIEKTHDYRNKLDTEFSEKATAQDKANNDYRAEIDEDFRKKEEVLQKEIDALDKKRKELDDSSNTHARREIRRDILKEIKNRQTEFKLTEGTNKLRRPIASAMLVLIGFFTYFGLLSGFEFYDVIIGGDINKILIAGAKQLLYSAGAVASIIFMIRWMNRWFELHSQSEFALKNFELDMERASWIVETSLEWKDAKGTAIPPELLDSLSSNLFENEAKVEQLQHPADQLASALLGTASAIKLKAGDSSIEVDPKKLAKQNAGS